MRSVKFANNYFYHVYNRGVDKRVIFQDAADFLRFYHSMYVFNDLNFQSPGGRSIFSRGRISDAATRDPLVRVVSFCLLSNHFHLLLQQEKEHGITTFLYRLGKGYAQYFNKRYERSGRLFQGEFQAVLVERDAQLIHLPRYIHLNALDMTDLEWREGRIKNWDLAKTWLDHYPWSSHAVYAGARQSLSVVDLDSVKMLFSTTQSYWDFLQSWSSREMAVSQMRPRAVGAIDAEQLAGRVRAMYADMVEREREI